LVFLVTVTAIYILSYLMAKYIDQWAINFGKEATAKRLYGNEEALKLKKLLCDRAWALTWKPGAVKRRIGFT